jgi:Cu/Ag efflux protein CusF
MKKTIIAIALSLSASTTAVFAAEMTGTVKAIDKSHDSITLTDGKTFTLPEGIEAETLKVGEKIKVVYSSKAGKLLATSIHAAK